MSRVFLIPNLISDHSDYINPAYYLPTIQTINIFFVEHLKPARKLLKTIDKNIVIDNFEWVEIHHQLPITTFQNALTSNKNIGIITDAGTPCIADPGFELVALAHQKGALISPLIGPNAIILALMASGFNGQHFSFHGYLPIDKNQRKATIKNLEKNTPHAHYTHIFIETPFRNTHLFETLLETCSPHTSLCLATLLNTPAQTILSKTILQWKKNPPPPNLHKNPTVFLLYSSTSSAERV